jgi:tRNA-dihydrouridine synthase
VTVKIRSGRRSGEPECAPDFARALEAAGASAVAVHGRTASQLYRGQADWGVVERVARAVGIPTIGSGDVRDARDAVSMMRQTGCAAVMLARGSYGDPWAGADAQALSKGMQPPARDLATLVSAFCLHVLLLEATGAHLARARSLAGWYLRGLPHAAQWRGRAMGCETVRDYLVLARQLADRAGIGVSGGMEALLEEG